MSGLYTVTTRSTGTVLTATVYNGDHQAHIDGHVPSLMDDYSETVSEMQTATDPGSVGSESRPTSLAGEIERLRYQLSQIMGTTHWYEAPGNNIMNTGVSIDDDDNISGHGMEIDFRTADFTLASGDNGKQLDCEKATDLTITVPPNSSVALPVGFGITVVQAGSGQVVFSAGSGVTIRTAETLRTGAQWAQAFLYKRATDVWVVGGALEAS